ncbi:MAG: putative circadian clock protein, KaiC [Candidatus Parvarchaeum acidiphilum ARMAN-4]|uniref:Putative circadian clock protein, KaiC n=1 Tax=Candidatus Parvarchaeum acidiphilum ARMAN-4 TaxID=662760 RepID=D2EGM1_PARA4|nr:MAG: putative circadian clock protein, KaiC [Candidatus Parvarchaeum acidiphilum ARMAN-4]
MMEKTNQTEIERETTGIPGLDEALNGGFPKSSVVFLTGTPGAGKTTFSFQFLLEGAKKGEKGLYFTLEESQDDLMQQFMMVDSKIKDYIEKGLIKIVTIPLVDYDSMKEFISSELDAMAAKRLVVDSITYLQMFFSDIMSIRKAVIELSNIIKARDCTAIFIGEMPYGENKLSSFGVEEFASDGVVALYMVERQSSFIRALRIIKMRSTEHLTKYIPLDIKNSGIVVYPSAELFADI